MKNKIYGLKYLEKKKNHLAINGNVSLHVLVVPTFEMLGEPGNEQWECVDVSVGLFWA